MLDSVAPTKRSTVGTEIDGGTPEPSFFSSTGEDFVETSLLGVGVGVGVELDDGVGCG